MFTFVKYVFQNVLTTWPQCRIWINHLHNERLNCGNSMERTIFVIGIQVIVNISMIQFIAKLFTVRCNIFHFGSELNIIVTVKYLLSIGHHVVINTTQGKYISSICLKN